MGSQFSKLGLTFLFAAALFVISGCGHARSRGENGSQSQKLSPVTGEAHFPRLEAERVSPLMWPLAKPRITQEFKNEELGKPHDGIDLSAPRGTRIYSPADGRVVYAGHKFHGYGKMIVIEHNAKLATIYGHCQKLLVKSGEWVHQGSLIGLVGKTGHATAPHLHFEVRLNKIPVNPVDYMP